jgi:hypothetical protein
MAAHREDFWVRIIMVFIFVGSFRVVAWGSLVQRFTKKLAGLATQNAQPESPLPVPQKPSTFHPRAQRNASCHRNARQQSRSFARWYQSLRRSSQLQPALLRLSAMILPVLHAGGFCVDSPRAVAR